MSFADFEQSIVSADLKAVAKHWNEVRGKKHIPSWEDIRPAAIAKQLPIVWSYYYDAQKDEFVGRLGGETISRIFGRSMRGAKLSELTPMIGREAMAARLRRVIQDPAFVSGYGALFTQLDRYGVGERIIMPLAKDGQHADSVIGATEYQTRVYIPSEVLELGKREEWFSLTDGG